MKDLSLLAVSLLVLLAAEALGGFSAASAAGAEFTIVEPGKRYTFTGVVKKMERVINNQKREIIALTENNDGRNIEIKQVRYLKDKEPLRYISQSLLDCIGNPDQPYDGPVEINCPVYLVDNGWVLLMSQEGTCRRLPR